MASPIPLDAIREPWYTPGVGDTRPPATQHMEKTMDKVTLKDGRQGELVDAQRGWFKVRLDDGTTVSVRRDDIAAAAPAAAATSAPAAPATEQQPVEASAPTETATPARNPVRPIKENSMASKKQSKKQPKGKKVAKKASAAKPIRKATNGATPMAALTEARKQYKEGKRSLICGDEVSVAIDGIAPADVVRIAAKLVEGVTQSRWAHLNPGQQRMNAGNMIRGAFKRGELTITAIRQEAKGYDRAE